MSENYRLKCSFGHLSIYLVSLWSLNYKKDCLSTLSSSPLLVLVPSVK